MLSYCQQPIRPIKEIIEAERLNPVHYQYEDAFLIVGMVERDRKMAYIDQMPLIKDSLLRVFDELIKVSHQLIRPESTLRKTEKQFLPEMSFEDESYRNALTEVSPALNKILEPFTLILGEFEADYSDYMELNFNEFVASNPIIKKITDNFNKVNEMSEKLTLLPFYTVARMIEIDLKELKMSLTEKIDVYREGIVKWAYDKMHKSVTELYKNIQTTLDRIKDVPKNSEKLVELEKFIEKIRKELEKQYHNEFENIRKWLTYLYGVNCTFTQDDYVNIHKTATILYSLPERVAAEEREIDEYRQNMEMEVENMTNQLNSDLNNLMS